MLEESLDYIFYFYIDNDIIRLFLLEKSMRNNQNVKKKYYSGDKTVIW